jgi:hypothetical protein
MKFVALFYIFYLHLYWKLLSFYFDEIETLSIEPNNKYK